MIVKLDDEAIKNLKKLDKNSATKIFQKIEKLKDFPEITNIKKLKNHIPPYRLRVGDYRVLFDIEDNILTVYKIKHRKNAYS
jgi:mRNA interferase RelE/StbE